MNFARIQSLAQQKDYHILQVKEGLHIEVHEKIGEGDNARIWKFKGLVIKVQKPQNHDGTFTMRGVTSGHTIEKVYPLSYPKFEKVILLDSYKKRKSKLYYIRDKVGKDAKFKSLLKSQEKDVVIYQKAPKEEKSES